MNIDFNNSHKTAYLCTIMTGSTLFGVCVVSGIVFEVLFSQYASLGFTIAWVGSGASLGIITLIVLGSFCWQLKCSQAPLLCQDQNNPGQSPTPPLPTPPLPTPPLPIAELDVKEEEPSNGCTIPQEVLEDYSLQLHFKNFFNEVYLVQGKSSQYYSFKLTMFNLYAKRGDGKQKIHPDFQEGTYTFNHFLQQSIFKNKVNCIKFLLEIGINPNIEDKNGQSLLYYSISYLQPDIAKLLLEHGAKTDAKTLKIIMSQSRGELAEELVLALFDNMAEGVVNQCYDGMIPLCRAIKKGYLDFIELLVMRHAFVDQIDEVLKITPLEYAIQNKCIPSINILLQAGANPLFQNPLQGRRTPLHLAVTVKPLSVLEALLSKVNDKVDILDDQGRTPLWCARSELAIGELTKKNANVFVKNLSGQNALFNTENDEMAVIALLGHGIDPAEKDHQGLTACHVNIHRDKIFRLLIEKVEDPQLLSSLLEAIIRHSSSIVKNLCLKLINNKIYDEDQLFRKLIEKNRLDVVKELLNLYSLDLPNSSLIFHATSVEMLQFFESKEANFWQISSEGETLLHAQARLGNREAIEFLMRKWVNPHITNNKGLTARDVAKDAETKALLEKGEAHEIVSFVGDPENFLPLEVLEMLASYLSIKDRENFRLINRTTFILDDNHQYYLPLAIKVGYEKDQDNITAKEYYKTVILGVIKLNIALNLTDHNSLEELACILVNNPKQLTQPHKHQTPGLIACLKYFAKEKNSIMIKWLIERGVDFNVPSSHMDYFNGNVPSEYSLSEIDCDRPPLEHAVLNHDKESTALLATQKIPIAHYTIHPFLHVAAMLEEVSILQSLLKNEALATQINCDVQKALLKESILNDERIKVNFLETAGIDLSVLNNTTSFVWDLCTPLHIAIAFQRINNIHILLANGADPDLRLYGSFSPLMFAVQGRNLKIVKLLLEGNKDQFHEDRVLSLDLAARYEDSSILTLLLQNEPFKKAINTFSRFPYSCAYELMKGTPYAFSHFTPLHMAIEYNCMENMRLLLENGADPNMRRGKKRKLSLQEPSPLMFAVLKENLPAVKLLLEKGGNILTVKKYSISKDYNPHSLTPLHFAVSQGNQEMLDLLLSVDNLNIDFPNEEGETPLMWAKTGKVVRFLIQKGASPHLIDIYGRNALFFVEEKDEDYLPALLEYKVNPNVISEIYGTCLSVNSSSANLRLLLPHINEETLNHDEDLLYRALCRQNHESAIELINAGLTVNIRIMKQVTSPDVMRALLKLEAVKNIIKDKYKESILCEGYQDKPEILKLLKEAGAIPKQLS